MNGWFADINHTEAPNYNQKYPWSPHLQCAGHICLSIESVTFASKKDCEDFIREHIFTAPQELI